MSYIKTCNRCGKSIFWLTDDGGKNVAFEDDVVTINKAGIKFADGKDNIKISTPDDVGKTKGFLCHWGRCK